MWVGVVLQQQLCNLTRWPFFIHDNERWGWLSRYLSALALACLGSVLYLHGLSARQCKSLDFPIVCWAWIASTPCTAAALPHFASKVYTDSCAPTDGSCRSKVRDGSVLSAPSATTNTLRANTTRPALPASMASHSCCNCTCGQTVPVLAA